MADKPSALNILVDEKRVNDLMNQRSGAKAIIRSGCNLLLFIFFLILYTMMALSEPITQQRAFEGYIRRRFDTSAAMPTRQVESVSSFWQYTNNSFVPGVYGNNTARFFYPGATVAKLLEIEGSEGANRLFGVIRMRMKKVQAGTECKIAKPYDAHFMTCYGPYSIEAEDKGEFGPVTETGDLEFTWRPDPGSQPYVGKMATYSAGGYMKALTADYNTSEQLVRKMESNEFISAATRAVFFDFTIYNFNLGLYAVCQLAFEVAPSGLWMKTFDVEVLIQRHLTPIGNREGGDWIALVTEVILMLFVLRYLLEEASEFIGFEKVGNGLKRPVIKMDYFADGWNIVDWLNLVLMIVALGLRMQTWGLGNGLEVYIGDPSGADLSTFTDLSAVAANVRSIHKLTAFNMVLTWFKGVKYINVLPYISTFMQTVSMSGQSLGSWIVVLSTVLFGFVLAYYVAFGEQMETFRTPWKAFIFLTRSLLGNADFSDIYNSAPFLGGLLIILFILGMLFIIMNLFYAIMISALADAKHEEDTKSAKKWEQTVDRAKDFWAAASEQLRLELRFRTCVPGLYSRIMKRRKKIEEKEQERDDAVAAREIAQLPTDLMALGPGNPTYGRRRKPEIGGEEASDNGSEPDLGPLISQAQLKRGDDESDDGGLSSFDANTVGESSTNWGEPSPEAIDLVIDATRHVANGIVERTRGAKAVLFGEMAESKEVLQKVDVVLRILGERAQNLEAHQRKHIKQFNKQL